MSHSDISDLTTGDTVILCPPPRTKLPYMLCTVDGQRNNEVYVNGDWFSRATGNPKWYRKRTEQDCWHLMRHTADAHNYAVRWNADLAREFFASMDLSVTVKALDALASFRKKDKA